MPDVLRDMIPAVPPGNPGDTANRAREARIRAAIDAQPPLSRAPLVPWASSDEFERCVSDRHLDGLTKLAYGIPALDQHYMLRRLGEEISQQDAADWADTEPNNPLALLTHASVLQHAAWRERGADRHELSADLTQTTFDTLTFDTYLGWSAELCEKAARIDPANALVAWVLAQRSVPMTEATRADVVAAARRWQEIDPLDYFGLTALLSELSPAWLGEPDDVLTLAREAHRRGGLGSVAHAAVPVALMELFVAQAGDAATLNQAMDVFRRHRPLLEAAHRRSLGSPKWTVTFVDGAVRNLFCFALFNADSDQLAWMEMKALRGHVLQHPWSLRYGDGMDAFADAREWLIRHVLEVD